MNTSTITRRKDKGLPGNGGKFAETEHLADDNVSLEETKPIRYSFLEDWQQKQDEFDETFQDVPPRFFSADLLGNRYGHVGSFLDSQVEIADELDEYLASFDEEDKFKKDITALINGKDLDEEEMQARRAKKRQQLSLNDAGEPFYVAHRLTQATSTPKDAKASSQDIENTALSLGLTDLEPVTEDRTLRMFKSDRAWFARNSDGGQVLLTDGNAGKKNFMPRRFRTGVPKGFDREFQQIDARTLIGSARLRKMTEVNPLDAAASAPPIPWGKFDPKTRAMVQSPKETISAASEFRNTVSRNRVRQAATLLQKTKEAQKTGSNFRSQSQYVKNSRSKTNASAWQDKLHPDKVHQELAANTRLNSTFTKVEIDNDVSPEEFADFEQSWMRAQEKLPKIPKDRQPTLRIRKLGRHRANGIYFPHVNTVCIDVKTSEATVHEMGHYYDIAVKDNASLNSEFSSIVSDYSKNLKMPEGSATSSSKYDDPAYYGTPTEVFARGFEMYSAEKLGVNGRVLKKERFDEFAFGPFKDPELKERAFRFFEKTFE